MSTLFSNFTYKKSSINTKPLKVVFLFMTLSAIQTAYGASFDCKKAQSNAEKIICSDQSLSYSDEEIASLYDRAQKMRPEIKGAIIEDHMSAFLKRESACISKQCVKDWNQERKATLQSYIDFKVVTAQETATLFKDICLGVAGLISAMAAVYGLYNWQREMKGRTKYECAKKLLHLTYKLRNEINQCRSRLIYRNEWPEEFFSNEGCDKAKPDAECVEHVYSNRLSPIYVTLNDFDTTAIEAEAIWGSEMLSLTAAFRQCIEDLNNTVRAYLEDIEKGGQVSKQDRDARVRVRRQLFGDSNGKDDLSMKIEAAIHGIEKALRPLLKH